MFWKKMPRNFWSYTAGKGDAAAEEREVARDRVLRMMERNLPGLAVFGFIMLLTLLMLVMMLAEFRGYYLDQIHRNSATGLSETDAHGAYILPNLTIEDSRNIFRRSA